MRAQRRERSDLDTTAQYFFSVSDLAARWHITEKTVREILKPYKGRCHYGRRGSHPRLCLWVPIDVVRVMDSERRKLRRPAV